MVDRESEEIKQDDASAVSSGREVWKVKSSSVGLDAEPKISQILAT